MHAISLQKWIQRNYYAHDRILQKIFSTSHYHIFQENAFPGFFECETGKSDAWLLTEYYLLLQSLMDLRL
jgi:hypothetical protein